MDGRQKKHLPLSGVAVKKAFAPGIVAAALMVAVAGGCSNSKKPVSSSVTEPLTPAPVAYQPAPQP